MFFFRACKSHKKKCLAWLVQSFWRLLETDRRKTLREVKYINIDISNSTHFRALFSRAKYGAMMYHFISLNSTINIFSSNIANHFISPTPRQILLSGTYPPPTPRKVFNSVNFFIASEARNVRITFVEKPVATNESINKFSKHGYLFHSSSYKGF